MSCGHCEEKKKATYVCGKCGKEEVKEVREGEEVKSCCGQNMTKKEEHIDKLAVQLKEWGAQIDQLKAKAGKGTAELKTAIDKEVVVLNKMMKDAQKNLQELKVKSGPAWKIFAEGVNKAWNDLREAMHQAGEKFK